MTPSATKPEGNSSGRVRSWTGPAILSYGYRPFFLLAGVWAALAMGAWVAMLAGLNPIATHFAPVDWHAHEMLFGFLGAVLAGFLLTAVPNWTGRMPIIGWPLSALVSLWVVGRIAIAVSNGLPAVMVAVLDLSFLTALAAVIGREILSGQNWRNLPLLMMLILFIVANGLFHFELARGGYAAGGYGFRTGLAVAVMLVTLIGGRIVPSFTRNWLAKRKSDHLPTPFGMFDRIVMVATLVALIAWVVLPWHSVTAFLCAIGCIGNLIRLGRWSGLRTGAEPLLWILHIGYLFVPLGFLAVALSLLGNGISPAIGAQHVWMAGAVGIMPLAMMTRASLGHSGRPLTATRTITAVYYLVIASVVLRFIASFGAAPDWVLDLSTTGWIAGFAGFSIVYWPILTKPRK